MKPRTDSRKFNDVSRRELLKLTPVIGLGAFANPQLQKPLLKGGLRFGDWASATLFRSGHLAPTFSDSDLIPFIKFPINDYDVDDPQVDLDKWTLTVSGAVQEPGDYNLGQIQALPEVVRQNTHSDNHGPAGAARRVRALRPLHEAISDCRLTSSLARLSERVPLRKLMLSGRVF